ncbi:hypothetical protein K435DRAFT_779824 [Dendrothele bispora CBS 962.96]|uniref:Uncharacterized protein n=1 Tax=Dendrothele bispora (strain CBS 962.96) TaxID=1314807 RepID=A0A4S8LWD0_DENBC|nr:hypothetical protein K435DRAFT_779824 [Dendrothele bispora CBS 962.96]
MSSQPEHVEHGDMRVGGTSATSTEENTFVTGIQTASLPRKAKGSPVLVKIDTVQVHAKARNQRATPAVDGDQTLSG